MPRNGSGVYSKPAGTTAVPNSTIESSKYNSVIDDIAADLNLARPIVAGGTGATTATAARTALGFSADAANFGVKGADIASAATTDLSTATGDYVTITGTTTITALGTSPAGTKRVVRFSGILILTHNATSLILPDAVNITTAAGDVAIFVSEGSGNWRCINYQRASSALQFAPPGYVFGLVATTNSGTPNTNIDVATGAASSSASPYYLLQITSSITKNTNSAWAVGSGNGSLDTGSIANSTYYGYVIQRSDTGVVDVITSLSSSSPTMPTNYDRRSTALFTFTRTAGVNSAPIMINSTGIQLGVAQNPVSGTSLIFPNIPSNAKRVSIIISGVTFSGSGIPEIRLGTAGGIVATGYSSDVGVINGGTGQASSTTGHVLANASVTISLNGTITFSKISGNTWVGTGITKYTTAAGAISYHSSSISLSGPLTQVSVTTQGGAVTYTAGTINGSWEF